MSERDSTAPEDARPIQGVPGYMVSRDGRVWSCRTRNSTVFDPSRWHKIQPFISSRGYPSFNITHPRRRQILVHRAVLCAFIGPCPAGMIGCHNDGNPLNPHVENLRWDTAKNNSADMVRHGTRLIGDTVPVRKLSERDVVFVKALLADGIGITAIGVALGVSTCAISDIKSGKNWRHV